jgi:hypothetical protein
MSIMPALCGLFLSKDFFSMSQTYNKAEVIRSLNLFVGKGNIAEIRIMNAFGVRGRNDSGYFDNFAQAAGALPPMVLHRLRPKAKDGNQFHGRRVGSSQSQSGGGPELADE